MTPEQMREAWKLIGAWRNAEACGFPGTIADAEKEVSALLSHYVRVPPPRPREERRCGQCWHYVPCSRTGTLPWNPPSVCPHYSEPGALPEVVFALCMAAIRYVDAGHNATEDDLRWLRIARLNLAASGWDGGGHG